MKRLRLILPVLLLSCLMISCGRGDPGQAEQSLSDPSAATAAPTAPTVEIPSRTPSADVPTDVPTGTASLEDDRVMVTRGEGKVRVEIALPDRAGEAASLLLLTDRNAAHTWQKEREKVIDLCQLTLDQEGRGEAFLCCPGGGTAYLIVTAREIEIIREAVQ